MRLSSISTVPLPVDVRLVSTERSYPVPLGEFGLGTRTVDPGWISGWLCAADLSGDRKIWCTLRTGKGRSRLFGPSSENKSSPRSNGSILPSDDYQVRVKLQPGTRHSQLEISNHRVLFEPLSTRLRIGSNGRSNSRQKHMGICVSVVLGRDLPQKLDHTVLGLKSAFSCRCSV